jgi:hypothetical protein
VAQSQNPNWPWILATLGLGGNPYAGSASAYFTDVTKRLVEKWSATRGHAYELATAQAGEWRGSLYNADGWLDPTNTLSPFAGQLLPLRQLAVVASYPATQNRLRPDTATAGDAQGFANGPLYPPGSPASDVLAGTLGSAGDFGAAGLQLSASGSAFQGSQVYSVDCNAGGSPAHGTSPLVVAAPVAAGNTYSFSVYVRNVTAGTAAQLAASILWVSASGVALSSSTGVSVAFAGSLTAGWTRLTATGVCPQAGATAYIGVAVTAALAAACSLRFDALQFELGAAATAWTAPGLWYPVFNGLLERLPQSWDLNGSYGLVQPVAVDVMALLSQTILPDVLTATINAPSPGAAPPSFVYSLGDPSGSTTFADSTGNRPPATVVNSKYGAAAPMPGTSVTSAATSGLPLGMTTTATTLAPANTGNNTLGAASVIALPNNASGQAGPAAGSGLGWTRMIAFKASSLPAGSTPILWVAAGPGYTNASAVYLLPSSSEIVLLLNDKNHSGAGLIIATDLDVGNWHCIIVGISADGFTYLAGADGVATWQSFGSTAYNPALAGGYLFDWIGAQAGSITDLLSIDYCFSGDVATVVEWPYLLTPAQADNVYAAWKTAYAGESSGQRYARIVQLAGYQGPTAIDAGQSAAMGPATSFNGQDAMTALQQVVDTENGDHFVAGSGAVTFYGRQRRYLAYTPAVVFGEQIASGEIPYEDVVIDFDDTYIANAVAVTQQPSGQMFSDASPSSQATFGTRSMTRTSLSQNTFECQDEASYLLSRYQQPHPRIASITLNPAANPAVWPVVLGLEIGQRVRVMRRPPGASPIQVDAFVQAIQVDADDQANATITLQLSPVDLNPYATFTTLRSSLQLQAASGTQVITLNPLPDAMTNSAGASLYPGQTLWLAPGTGAQTAVTVQSLASTVPGYGSVAVTLTAALTATFAAGTPISEPLPANETAQAFEFDALFDTAAWDTAAAVFDPVNVFDISVFSY